nr:MAG TPA: hypothetical protein [Caudoviricetes sp.]
MTNVFKYLLSLVNSSFFTYFSLKSFSLITVVFLNRIHLRIHFYNHICPYS